jgi:transposase
MIKMDTKQEILRRYFRESDSERKIARDLKVNRKTVKKYLEEYLDAKDKSETEGTNEVFQDYSTSAPDYNAAGRSKRKLTNEISNIIGEQLEENDRKRRNGLRKQVKLKTDIHEYLLSLGYKIGYTTVCNHIRSQAISDREAFIRQVYIPGEECEFDWAETKLTISGVQRRLYLAVFTSSYGNYRYARLYVRQDTLAFMESHNDFFGHVGGVFHEMVYDNMRVAIAEFVGRSEKHPTIALTNLAGWFQFRWRFCNIRRGNEKGHVERSVEYVRRKSFSNRDNFDSIEQAQDHLSATIERLNQRDGTTTGKSSIAALSEERTSLWKYPGEMECYVMHSLKVDKYATFSYGTNRYSVPDYLVGKIVDVKVYSNRLKVYHNNLHLFTHERNYGKYQWHIELNHYLVTLARKPGALHGSAALEQAPPPIRRTYHHYFENRPRDFVEILIYCRNNSVAHEKLEETVRKVNRLCNGDIAPDKIIALLGNQQELDISMAPPSKEIDEIEDLSFRQLQEITLLTENRVKHQTV